MIKTPWNIYTQCTSINIDHNVNILPTLQKKKSSVSSHITRYLLHTYYPQLQ